MILYSLWVCWRPWKSTNWYKQWVNSGTYHRRVRFTWGSQNQWNSGRWKTLMARLWEQWTGNSIGNSQNLLAKDNNQTMATHLNRPNKGATALVFDNDYNRDSKRLCILIYMITWAIWKSRNKNAISNQDISPIETKEIQWLKKLVHIWQKFPCVMESVNLKVPYRNQHSETKKAEISWGSSVCRQKWGSPLVCAHWWEYDLRRKGGKWVQWLMGLLDLIPRQLPKSTTGTQSVSVINTLTRCDTKGADWSGVSVSWHKVAAQAHVSHSTVRRHYSVMSYTLPRQCGGHSARLSAQGQSPLFTKSLLEQLTLPLNSRKLWTWVFVSIPLGTH